MAVTRPLGPSKSTFLMRRQCSKLLWFRYNAKDHIPIPDESTQAVKEADWQTRSDKHP